MLLNFDSWFKRRILHVPNWIEIKLNNLCLLEWEFKTRHSRSAILFGKTMRRLNQISRTYSFESTKISIWFSFAAVFSGGCHAIIPPPKKNFGGSVAWHPKETAAKETDYLAPTEKHMKWKFFTYFFLQKTRPLTAVIPRFYLKLNVVLTSSAERSLRLSETLYIF